MSEPREPTPPEGEHVPPAVLDELRAAFGGPSEAEPARDDTGSAPTAATEPRRTIVIGDDDLPDPVYLDPPGPGADIATARAVAGDDDSGRTIVIGDELEASGAFDAVAPPTGAMDPRLRARRIAVKRAKGRKRLWWTAAVVGVVVAIAAVLAVFASGLFAVERVDVEGAVYTSARNPDQLQAVVDSLVGEPVLLVDTRAAERQLEQIAWVEAAFVRTDFPHRAVIDLRERQPLATFQGSDDRYRVIDHEGRVLDVLAGRPVDYLLVTGVGPDLDAGAMAGRPYAEVAQLVGALPPELRLAAASASVEVSTGDLGLVLTGPDGPVEVRVGTFDRLEAKLARLLQQVRDGLDDVSRIDVATDEVVVTPIPGP